MRLLGAIGNSSLIPDRSGVCPPKVMGAKPGRGAVQGVKPTVGDGAWTSPRTSGELR